MTLANVTSNELISFFPAQHHEKLITIYNNIPTNLIKFLNQRNIIQYVNFNRTMQTNNRSIGNEYNKQWNSFINHLCQSIKKVFREENVTCVDPHELAVDISNRYTQIVPGWARRAQILRGNLQFNNIYTIYDNGIQIARTDVEVKVEIEEICEDNCVDTNQYLVRYHVDIKLKALTTDGHKVRVLCELINRDGTDVAIEYIKHKT